MVKVDSLRALPAGYHHHKISSGQGMGSAGSALSPAAMHPYDNFQIGDYKEMHDQDLNEEINKLLMENLS